MASYSVVFIDKDGISITGNELSGEIPANTSKLVFYNTGVEFHDDLNTLVSVSWDDIYQGTAIETILYNGSSVSDGEEVDYNDDNIEITVCYEYTPSSGTGGTGSTGSTGGTEEDNTPMVVTFNYYIDGEFIDDEKLEAIGWGGSEPVEERWPRTLECYHIRFDKINQSGDSTAGTGYNSLEFTYIYENKFNENDFVDNWPSTGTLNNTKTIQAFTHRYFVEENCVTINGIGYNGGEDFTETPKPIFHSNNTKTLEVNLYYISDKVSIKVHSYNVDDSKYIDYDLWGYVSAQMGRVPGNFTTTYAEYEYAVPLTSGYSMYCRAIPKPGFEFGKWVSTSRINSIENYENLSEKERRNAVLALPAIESLDDSLPDEEIQISAYSSKDITAVFKSVKHEVKLYKGLDFSDSDIYYIWSGDNQWKNNENSDVDITIPNREGATLLGWVDYNQEEYDPDIKEYPYITRSEYNAILLEHDFDNLYEDIFNYICDSTGRERIISGVIRIDVKDGTKVPILISNNEGYTDSCGNWLTGDKTLYPLWLLEEYDITYKSAGKDSLVVDESEMVDGILCVLNPSDYYLPTTYTIADDFVFTPLIERPDLDTDFPQYYSFDRWVPSEIKPFTITGPQTITAYWILDTDTYKITLEKNNNYANQSVRIKIGESKFVNEEKINNPTTRTAYKSFEGWYTENDINTENGTGQLIIDKEGNLQPNVSGYTNSNRGWIRNENTTVYAKWTPEEYTITYHIYYNGEYEVIFENYTIEDTKPDGYHLLSDNFGNLSPEGHYLEGWYTNEDYSGSQISVLERGTTGDKTFYGRFKPIEYTIVYNIDENNCSNYEDLPKKHTYGSVTSLDGVIPIVQSYEFLGWYTDEQFTNKITSIPADYRIQVGDSFFGYIYLYAKLVLEQIPILYKDSNDNVIDDSLFNETPPRFHYYGLTTQLKSANKEGYTFDGWYNNIECSGEKLTVLEGEDYLTDIVLFCKFTPIEKTIKYYIDGIETTDIGNPSAFTVEDLPITLENPENKTGYHSIGWRRNSSSSTTVVNQITYLDDWNLYWVWEPNVVTITWNANGGTVSPSSNQYTYDGDSVELPIPTRDGYEFSGWYTSTSGGTKITDIGVNNKPTEDITYYALWNTSSEVKYTVKHFKQALDGTYPDNLCVTEEYYGTTGDSVTPDVKEYSGFTSPIKQTVIIASDESTVVEYEYTRNKYNITWDVNGGETLTGDYTNGSVYFETPIIKPSNPTKEGYVFSGWSPSIPEKMPANDIVFTASYIEEKTNLISEIIDTELETVTVDKIATDKWINNVIGEPETTNFEHLGNFFNTTFGSNISGECITGNDLENFFSTELNKCIKQSQFIEIFSKSENVSNGYIVEKNFTFSISSNNASNLEFTVTIPESEESIPNYPNTTGFIMYYTLGSNPTLYKTYIPINKSCHFSLENTSDSIVIHRIPLYYLNSMNACILPKITIQNNTNRIVGDTLIASQIID